jgi:hypothetical protein
MQMLSTSRPRGPGSISGALAGSLIVACCCFAGCQHNNQRQGTAKDLTVSLKRYVSSKVGRNAQIGGKFSFPALQIYDPNGHLIYCGHDVTANEQLLTASRDIVSRENKVVPASSSLSDILSELTDAQAFVQLSKPNAFTYLAIDLQDCHACSIQEHNLSENKNSILRSGSNLITLMVDKEERQ